MNKLQFLLIFALLALVACGSSDEVDKKITWNAGVTRVVDFEMWIGSVARAGAIVPPIIDTAHNVDSVKNAIMNSNIRYFKGAHQIELFKNFSVEFNDNYLTYIDSSRTNQIVSKYTFKEDSLFINLSNGTKRFVAQGSKESLYRSRSLLFYRMPTKDTTIVYNNEVLTQQKALEYSGYNTLTDLTNVNDTLIWCNVRYVFD